MLNKYPLFDSHMHIIDNNFPLVENNGYLPDVFNCADYLTKMAPYDLKGGVVVSGSFQAYDQGYLVDALSKLGNSFVGVTQLAATVTDAEILRLNDQGVRAVRFNLKRGGSESSTNLETMARRIYELANWHVELYVDSKHLPDLYSTLVGLPSVSIDHLGLSSEGFKTVIKLAEQGVKVKATGFSRVNFDVKEAISSLYNANPACLMFASDLPSTRAPRMYSEQDFMLVCELLSSAAATRVFSQNAIELYRPKAFE